MNNVEQLNRLFKAAGLKSPVEVPEELSINPAGEAFQALERQLIDHGVTLGEPDEPGFMALMAKKKLHMEFVEKYSAGFATPSPPFKMRLVYNGLCQRDFEISTGVELVFGLFECCQELLDDYEIKTEPESIELFVYREPFRHPKSESRVHPRHRDPAAGAWIPIMSFRVQEATPFFSFEELELAHPELWRMVPEYARRKMNPCGEIPLVDQNLGIFLPMQ